MMSGDRVHPCLAAVVEHDQRGMRRPADGDRTGGPICDIGAVEVEGAGG